MAGFPKLSLTLISSSFILFLSLLPAVIATGNYGPDTCLQGWVWREASPTDHVCVTPQTRSQTAYDNTQATARKNPNGGPYGPDTCLQGYVWREAFTNDHVCVTPATRTEAPYDNTQASNRRASLNTWTSIYYEFGYPLLQVHGDHFNFGPVKLVFNSTGEVAYFEETVNATAQAGYVAGAFSYPTYLLVCASTSLPPNAQVSVYDPISDRWSTPLFLRAGQSC